MLRNSVIGKQTLLNDSIHLAEIKISAWCRTLKIYNNRIHLYIKIFLKKELCSYYCSIIVENILYHDVKDESILTTGSKKVKQHILYLALLCFI